MLNSKQRATLRGMANTIDTILQIGKSEVSDTLIKQVDDALTARELIKLRVLETALSALRVCACVRELIKLRVLETAPYSPQEAAELVAEKTQSEVVQVIGTRFVLYRRNRKKPVIEI